MRLVNLLLATAAVLAPLSAHAGPGPRLNCPRYVTADADGFFSVECEVGTNARGAVTLFTSVIPCDPTMFERLGIDHSQIQPSKGSPDAFHVVGKLAKDAAGNYQRGCFIVIVKDADGNELDRSIVTVRAP